MTLSACDTFFSLPELIAHVASFLSKQDLNSLSQANRAINSICSPVFWRDFDLSSTSVVKRFIDSPEAQERFNTNIDHIRTITWGTYGSLYYINALWKYLNSTTVSEVHRAIPTDALTHPRWGQMSTTTCNDPSIRCLCPLLLLTHYISLPSASFYVYKHRVKHAHLWQAREPRQHQLFWLLRLNRSTLTYLQFIKVPLLSSNLVRDLCRTISQIKTLKTLLLIDPQGQENFSLQVFEKLFFSCPPSLVELSVQSYTDMSTEDMNLDPHEDDWDSDQGLQLLRNEPLQHLKKLQLPSMDSPYEYPTPFLSSILKHCPAVEEFIFPAPRRLKTVLDVSQIIRDSCPNIAGLTLPYLGKENNEAFMVIMDRMHEQRLKKIQVSNLADKSSSMISLSAFLCHSTTLRQVKFDNCRQLASTTLRAILTSCHVLETLMVEKASKMVLSNSVALSLKDAVETEWVCTRIRQLTILVKLTPDGRDPTYFADTTKMTWTERDHHHWKMLDQFYTQIGSLRELEILSLKATGSCRGEYGGDVPFRQACLPGLLALEDTTTAIGQIGFLSRWAGLDKLQELRGSISVTTKEVSARMGQREVAWFAGHLLALRIVTFAAVTVKEGYRDRLPKILKDLLEHRPELLLVEFV